MKIFITGASGFIGRHLTMKLCKEHTVKILVNCNKPDASPGIAGAVRGSIDTDGGWVQELSDFKPDYVIHMAGRGLDPAQRNDPRTIQVNVEGTFRLLRAVENLNIRGIILTGSCLEYGANPGGKIPTGAPLHPTDLYGSTKAAATNISKIWAQEKKIKYAITRPFTVYGPDEANYRVEYQIAKALLSNRQLSLSPGQQRRDFIYIDDLVHAYERIISKSSFSGEIYNIGSGKSVSRLEFGDLAAKITGTKRTPLLVGSHPYRSNEIMELCADISELHALGWQPQTRIEAGIGELVKYVSYKENLKA